VRSIQEIQERGFTEILDCLNSGVYITDTNRRIVYWNRRAEEITGYKAGEVVGYHCGANILRHRDKDGRVLCQSDHCPLRRSMERAKPSDGAIVVFAQSKNGEDLLLATSTAPVFADDGTVIGGVELFHDERDSLHQMELARMVQRQMLPARLPEHERLSFALQFAPKDMVSGDFYRIERVSADVFSMFLADAAGHGVSAGLSAALIYAMALECRQSEGHPAEFLRELNERACLRAAGLGFFTAVAAVVNLSDRTAAISSAGHPPALIRRSDGAMEKITTTGGLPIGIAPGTRFEVAFATMSPGDSLVLYSDGATEMRIDEQQRLGIDGLAAIISSLGPAGDPTMAHLYGALLDRCKTVEPEDDVTLLRCALK